MTVSFPSPSETCSDWSSSASDCGTSSSGSQTAFMTRSNEYLDCYSTASLAAGREAQSHQQRPVPVALLPSSTIATPSVTRHGGRTPMTVTPDGEIEPHSPTNNPHRRRYATEDDWRCHRDRISSLYRTKRLKDVIAVMEAQYQFFATERMYKARFKEWGIEKNVTAAKVHQLMQRVEEEQQRRRSPSASGGRAGDERVVLDVGEDLDVKRIQKYMKRKPAGLEKLRSASKRSLEVIKALSVDSGKGGGRGKVSIPVVKLEQQALQNMPDLTLSNFTMQWPPAPELPDEVVGLLQAFVDNHFDCPYPFAPVSTSTFPPLTPVKWQLQGHSQSNPGYSSTEPFVQVSQQDETMLDSVLKLHVAQTLLDDGLASEGTQAVTAGLELLAFCIQQAQNESPMDTRPATQVILWAFLAASEMMSDFSSTKKLILQMLFQRMVALCAGYQPTMAELVKRISQLGAPRQAAALKLARYSISQALLTAAEYQPAFETYSKTVSIFESPLSPDDKLRAIQRLANDPVVHESPFLEAWMETRIALWVPAVSSSPFNDCIGSYCTAGPQSWYGQGHNRMSEVLGTIAGKVEWHKASGNWQVAQQLGSRSGSIAQTVWGYNGNAVQGAGGKLNVWSPPEQTITSSLAPVEPSMFHVAIPEATLGTSHPMGETPGWGEPQPQQQQQHQGQVPAPGEHSSMAVWDATAAYTGPWQVDADFGNDSGMYGGPF